jgi:hypothetical protein
MAVAMHSFCLDQYLRYEICLIIDPRALTLLFNE